jgi:hypothetical protein
MLGRPRSVAGIAFDAIARGVADALGWKHVGEEEAS